MTDTQTVPNDQTTTDQTTTDQTTTDQTTTEELDAEAVAALVDTHLAAFSAPTSSDGDERRRLVERAWAPEGHFADPLFAATGHDEIDALAGSVPGLYPGHTFQRTSPVDLHHGHARYAFAFTAPDGTTVIDGVEVAQVGRDGRLVRVIGFFGPLPTA